MSRAYSLDVRERVVASMRGGLSSYEAAAHYQVSQSSAQRWFNRALSQGRPAALPVGGRRGFLLADKLEWITRRLAEAPDTTLRGLLRWKRHQGKIDASRLIFVDETWAKTNMTPIQGWCPRGERLIARVPHGHWKTLTFIAGLRPLRPGWPGQRPQLPGVGRAIPGPNTASWRHRGAGQSRQSQKPGRAPGNPQRRRQFILSAALRPRPEPHRTGLRQSQNPAPQNRSPHGRRHLERHPKSPQRLRTSRMRQLPQKLRLCVNLKISDSSGAPYFFSGSVAAVSLCLATSASLTSKAFSSSSQLRAQAASLNRSYCTFLSLTELTPQLCGMLT